MTKKAQLAHMKGINGTFYQDDGRTMTVTADEGEVHMDSKDVVLTKNPHGVTSDGGDAVADKFTWINKDQTVVGEGNVRLKKDDTVATAQKATFNVALDQAKLEEDAHVQKGEF